MEKFKSILPFVIIALIFGIGGYFIGTKVNINNQGASLFSKTVTPAGGYFQWDDGLKACFEYRYGPYSEPYLVAPRFCGQMANNPSPKDTALIKTPTEKTSR